MKDSDTIKTIQGLTAEDVMGVDAKGIDESMLPGCATCRHVEVIGNAVVCKLTATSFDISGQNDLLGLGGTPPFYLMTAVTRTASELCGIYGRWYQPKDPA